jgi:hypothetical protein
LVFLCAGIVVLLGGCYATGKRSLEQSPEVKIVAEAYSFNARLWRDGKPTTFKLELYQTDSLLGLSGRGYLGKGALRGWVRSDSIKVYFPSTNELLYEPLDAVVAASSCPFPLAGLDLLGLMSKPPDSIALAESLQVDSDYGVRDRARFKVRSIEAGCTWELALVYRRRDLGWRIDEFDFDDGRGTRLRASCNLYRARAKVPLSRIEPGSRPDARRIVP